MSSAAHELRLMVRALRAAKCHAANARDYLRANRIDTWLLHTAGEIRLIEEQAERFSVSVESRREQLPLQTSADQGSTCG